MILNKFYVRCVMLWVAVSCGGCRDSVVSEFSWLLDGYISAKVATRECRNWYRVFKITEQEKIILLTTDFTDQHFEPWTPFRTAMTFPDGYSVDGSKRMVMQMRKENSDDFDGVYVLLDVERNEIVLVWGRTYGV